MIGLNIELTGGLLDDRGQRSGFVVLAAFLVAFLFIRTSARLSRSPRFPWWPGSVKTSSGLHIHHLVWGVSLILITGFLAFSFDVDSPWRELLAIAFGIGAGFTLDEFALIIHLDDVYWAEEGRKSIDAVVIAGLLAGVVVIGVAPFDLKDSGDSIAAISITAFVVFGIAAIAIAKGKYLTGVAGMFVPLIALVGAVRLARPDSPWAQRRYPPGSEKLARAQARDVTRHKARLWWMDRVGGAPTGDPQLLSDGTSDVPPRRRRAV